MKKEINITIPEDLSEITVGQFLEYKDFLEAEGEVDNDSLAIKTVSIFCDISLALTHSISWSDVNEINDKINKLFEGNNYDLVDIIDINGTRYGFEPDLEKISFYALVDLDDLLGKEHLINEVMAVLYRPVIQEKFFKRLFKKSGSTLYQIEPYDNSSKYAEDMKDMPLSVALGCLGFISHLGSELLKSALTSLKEEKALDEDSQRLLALAESGVGTVNSVFSLQTISS